jgi:UDP-N-acetyl-D-glucosamine dehydrogenase
MPFYPGPGVGGHCIPCDPHYLLQGLRERRGYAPVIERAMKAIAMRPTAVVSRALDVLAEEGVRGCEARVLVVGAAYKPGVRDVREAPAVRIMHELAEEGVEVSYHDPLVRSLGVDEHLARLSVPHPLPSDYDLALVVTIHEGHDYGWLDEFEQVLDCTYQTPLGRTRVLI